LRRNCIFCGTVCKKLLEHLKKYHKSIIKPFPETETTAGKFFRRRRDL